MTTINTTPTDDFLVDSRATSEVNNAEEAQRQPENSPFAELYQDKRPASPLDHVVERHVVNRSQVTWQSPIGPLRIVGTPDHITGIFMEGHTPAPRPFQLGEPLEIDKSPEVFRLAIDELTEYFAGTRQHFTFPHRIVIGTKFQKEVWQVISAIPYGGMTTYGAIADTIGRPKAVRAVGAAVGRNPLSLIIPCHRVLGSGGRLTGYAGGVERKAYLLQLEDEHAEALGTE